MSEKKRLPLAGARRKAREFALLGVYESLINKEADFAEIDAGLLSVITDEDGPVAGCDLTPEDFEACDKAFCREILAGVMADRAKIDGILSHHVDRELDRLSVIERACLTMGTWELMHCPQVPYRVVINEAVELAKQFGSDKGYRLVNGVLDKTAAEVRPDEVNAEKAGK